MSLIGRYVLRETFGAWSIVVAVLFLILMTNQFAELLGEAASQKLPRNAVLAIFALTSLQYLTLIAPVALFLGVMLALARLNRDSEMAALSACGVGPVTLLGPVGVLTLALTAGVAWLALAQTPMAAAQIERIRAEAREALGLGAIVPERFTSPDGGATVLYAREVAGEQIGQVFFHRQQDERVIVILADRLERIFDRVTGRQSFVFHDGRRYEGVPGESEFLIVEFGQHGVPFEEPLEESSEELPIMKSTARLLRSGDPADRAELQWRVSAPLSMLVLGLLAVPLGRSSPREGRYARIGMGLLIYVSYANALSIARVWVERGQTPEWLGMWWVHAALALVGLVLLAREEGWFRRPRPPRSSTA